MRILKPIFLLLAILLQVNISFAQKNKPGKKHADTLLVIDKKNGLMWMKHDFAYLEKRFLVNWDECFQWQQKINAEKYGGYDNWYVPNIAEYRTINHSKAGRELYRQNFVELDTVCVWGHGAYSFWARNERTPDVASYISFIDGFATSGNKNKQVASGDWEGIPFGFSVRLVRKISK